jgi:hypothetical protein
VTAAAHPPPAQSPPAQQTRQPPLPQHPLDGRRIPYREREQRCPFAPRGPPRSYFAKSSGEGRTQYQHAHSDAPRRPAQQEPPAATAPSAPMTRTGPDTDVTLDMTVGSFVERAWLAVDVCPERALTLVAAQETSADRPVTTRVTTVR